ncbi:hypothetical protein BWQ96_08915 [Gracilariopsis chorda]|uniref:Uncharacterized protein n=1 Tax=Gracilariopsis chorda TaxID=448386 RepID=A0A2V3IH20_9FLOR|nr:hypothetical protein BWQ96_08915 [Gracilariopsis chorda]|eukprot:PXF41367.1 hypothetical protein BWQ96_08915 [Gracilariopsis chorda]
MFTIHMYDSETTLGDVMQSDGDGQSHARLESMSTRMVTFENRSSDAVKLERDVGSLLWERERSGEEGGGLVKWGYTGVQ